MRTMTGRGCFSSLGCGGRADPFHRKYAIPNDEAEQDRLDIMHHVYLLLFKGELHLAPISSTPEAILDVGTGTGIWAIDIAE